MDAPVTMSFYTDVLKQSPVYHSAKRQHAVELLEPETARRVLAVIQDAAEVGHDLRLWETFRSEGRQRVLYEQGRSGLARVGVHHYGLAADLVLHVDETPTWEGRLYDFLGPIASLNGLVWGGKWRHPDPCHVQRVAVLRQPDLFRGLWYPNSEYDPTEDE